MLEKGLSDTQYKEIMALLETQIQENVGMAMVFTLCEAVREYLVENNHKGNVRVLMLTTHGALDRMPI